LFDLPVALFGDAGTSFDAGAYYATSILCRAALEAALYLFLTRSKNGQPSGAWVVHPPFRLDGTLRRVEWTEVKSAISKRKILSYEHIRKLERIQKHGNVAAHLASRTDAMIAGKPIDLRTSPDQALEDLRDTAEILRELATILSTKPDLGGPDGRTRLTVVEARFKVVRRKQN